MMTPNSESLLINAHADMSGNNKLSATPSQRRAVPGKQFLISKVISAVRITINWADEGQLAGNSENRNPVFRMLVS